MAKKKMEDFNNPALDYLSDTDSVNDEPETYEELRTRNVHLLFKPSMYEMVKQDARKHKMSINAYIEQLIKENH